MSARPGVILPNLILIDARLVESAGIPVELSQTVPELDVLCVPLREDTLNLLEVGSQYLVGVLLEVVGLDLLHRFCSEHYHLLDRSLFSRFTARHCLKARSWLGKLLEW